ncbi:MAG: hypothetical protein ACR2K5_12875 [Pseudolabrys sp.]
MSLFMFVAGILAVVIGVVLIAAGVPVKEFSFGNTLILAGTVTAAAGLIVIGLGAVLSQLLRIADMLGARPAERGARSLEPFDQAGGRAGQDAARIPFPPKPKAAARADAPQVDTSAPGQFAEPAAEEPAEPSVSPTLRNPELDFADAKAEDAPENAPLMPKAKFGTPRLGAGTNQEFTEPAPAWPHDANGAGAGRARNSPASPPDSGWRAPASPPAPAPAPPPPPNYFEAKWPNERSAEPHARTPITDDGAPMRDEPAMRETIMRETVMRESVRREPSEPARLDQAAPPAAPEGENRAVAAILKSGVIDGMGYTLFADGSIEAELPQGTLRFASIAELRDHLDNRA